MGFAEIETFDGEFSSYAYNKGEALPKPDPPEVALLTCDCGKEVEAKLIAKESRLYEWNCPVCGLQRDSDA